LTLVKVSHLTEDALRALEEMQHASLPKSKPQPASTPAVEEKKKVPKLSKEEEHKREKWRRLVDMVKKGRIEPLKTFWMREGADMGGVDTFLPEWLRDEEGGKAGVTLLQVATSSGQEEIVRWLREDLRADPTIPISSVTAEEVEEPSDAEVNDPAVAPRTRHTAFHLARSRHVRDVFRRCAYAHPDWYDWKKDVGIPNALSPEMEEEREKKKNVRRRGLKDKMKEREEERAKAAAEHAERMKREEEERARAEALIQKKGRSGGNPLSQKLGGGSGGRESLAGLSAEMRAQIERERRARAAEARLAGRTT
jgi:hypothetical protein